MENKHGRRKSGRGPSARRLKKAATSVDGEQAQTENKRGLKKMAISVDSYKHTGYNRGLEQGVDLNKAWT